MYTSFEICFLTLFAFIVNKSLGQVYLRANSSTSTYNRINKILGGTGTAVEVPDCIHTDFGDHIRQQYDNILQHDVFAFYAHVTPDNDRCKTFDRQRVEIKTYDPSPEYLKGREGESVSFSWNFKLDGGFQPSKSFTHIHQIKAVEGDDLIPILTLTARLGNPNKLELIHIDSTGAKTTRSVPLPPFMGQWVHVKESITYGTSGKYSITATRISDGLELLSHTSNNIDLWRIGASFVRPKWGIYRSLASPDQIRDEIVLFDTFCLAKGNDTCV